MAHLVSTGQNHCAEVLVVLSMGGERLDTRNPTSKLMLTILAGVATWEREIMLEKQREGIAKAKGSSGNIRIEYHTIGLFLDFRCLRSLLPHLDD